MRVTIRSVLTGALLGVVLMVGGTVAHAAVWSSSAAFGSWTSNGYTLNNDVWGSGAGPQTIWANSSSNWGVWTQQPATNGVKSYPHAEFDVNRSLSAISTLTSSFNVTVPGTGVYDTAYDIWLNNSSYEVMLWMNEVVAGPLGSFRQNVTSGGFTWRVYAGSNGSNTVYSFVNTGESGSGSVTCWPNCAGCRTTDGSPAVRPRWAMSSSDGRSARPTAPAPTSSPTATRSGSTDASPGTDGWNPIG